MPEPGGMGQRMVWAPASSRKRRPAKRRAARISGFCQGPQAKGRVPGGVSQVSGSMMPMGARVLIGKVRDCIWVGLRRMSVARGA